MSTPNVIFALADFTDDVSGAGYLVQLSPSYHGTTDSDGEVTFSSVTPGVYVVNAPNTGIPSYRITVPNVAGPVDAVDCLNEGQGFVALGANTTAMLPGGKSLIAGQNIAITDSGDEIVISATASSTTEGDVAFTDTVGALSVESEVADGASAVAFSFDTANALSTSGSTFASLLNNGEQIAKIAPNGGVFIGKNIEGTLDFSELGFSAVSSLADDGVGYIQSYLAAINSDEDTEEAYYRLELNNVPSGSSKITLGCYDETFDYRWYQQTSIGNNNLNEFGFAENGNVVLLQFRPMTEAGDTPYIFDTGVAHTSGNLVEFKNNGTLKASVNFAGKLTVLDALQTAAPTGGTAGAWKLGIKVDAVTLLDTAKYLQVDIGGTLYKVALVTS